MRSPWKDPRTGTYYLRRGVPTEIRDVTVDGVRLGSIYKRSLQTKDSAEAKLQFPIELAKCNRLFERAYQQLSTPALDEISREGAERLADAWFAALLEEDEEIRMEGWMNGI